VVYFSKHQFALAELLKVPFLLNTFLEHIALEHACVFDYTRGRLSGIWERRVSSLSKQASCLLILLLLLLLLSFDLEQLPL